MSIRDQVIETINKLFIYTDNRQWDHLSSEVFADEVFLDMTSLGGESRIMQADEICQMWETGFTGIDSISHLSGNFIVEVASETEAKASCYALATHFKKSAANGQTRDFMGSYDFILKHQSNGWRIHSFTYHLKYITGNVDLS